jgi:hypothetical protein
MAAPIISKIVGTCGQNPSDPGMSVIIRREGVEMKKIENQTLVKETLVLEELFFVNCVVRECALFYSGGDFDWINTRFENCQLLFRDGAKRTMALLQQFGMVKAGGEQPTVGGTSSTRVQ